MGLLTRLGGSRYRANMSPLDERAWTSYTAPAVSGVTVDAESAMRISAVWACVRLISQSLASIPLIVYRRAGRDGRERAPEHPLYDILHVAPNPYQTAFEFKRQMTLNALLRGNGIALITPGIRRAVDALTIVHPDRTAAPEMRGGVYQYPILQEDNITWRYYMPDEVFHLCGLSQNGLWGMSVIEYAREAMGLSLATESYGARQFSQTSMPRAVLTHPGRLSNEARQKLKSEWEASFSGLDNAHRTAVLAEDIKFETVGMSSEDAQFLETRTFQVADIARWFGVDLSLLQENTKSTSWGTGIEQMLLAFKTFTLLPWAKLWQEAISRDLIWQSSTYYAEFLFDALVQPDLHTRYTAYDIAIKGGWKSRNEIRRLENDNPVDGLDGYDRPLNMGDATKPARPADRSEPDEDDEETAASAQAGHYRNLVREAAGRVVRKELAALTKATHRGDDWEAAVGSFYADHAPYVAATMQIAPQLAAEYVDAQRSAALEFGLAGLAAGATLLCDLVMREAGDAGGAD